MTTPVPAARLLDLDGHAWTQHDGVRLPLSLDSPLTAGQVLETGPDAQLRLLLASGHELQIGPSQCLCLDEDVLATSGADASEWLLSSHADAATVADWLLPTAPALTLDGLLESHPVLDSLFGPAALPLLQAYPENGLIAADDHNLNQLLRSLYGPDVV